MTDLLSKERLQGIKEAASDVAKEYGPTWLSSLIGGKNGNYHAITSDHTNDVVVRADDDKRESSWLCDYLESVSPAAVTALIDELLQRREAAEKPVAWIVGSEEIDDFKCGREVMVMRDDDEEELEKFPLYSEPPLASAERAAMLQYSPVQALGITAEHRRVIEMLLSVCAAAFELADDSCEQEVDGEMCHVVPGDAFQKLSDSLDEIENTLPTEDADRPDVFLAWSAMPRAVLKSLLQLSGNSEQVIDYKAIVERISEIVHGKVTDIDLLTITVKSMVDRLKGNSPVIPEGWALVPIEPTEAMLILLGMTGSFDSMIAQYQKALAAAPQPSEPS